MTSILRFCILIVAFAYTLAPIFTIFLVSISPNPFELFLSKPTFHWYQTALANSTVHAAFLTSLTVALLVSLISVALGFLSNRLIRKLSPALSLICMITISIPALMPALVSGFSLHAYFTLTRLDGTLAGIIASQVIYISPIAFFLLFFAHNSLNPDIEECARNMGASEHQITFQVVLPQLTRACYAAAIICGLLSWDEFVITWFVSGFHKTLPTLVYGMLGNSLDPSLYAIGTLITLISFASLIVLSYLVRKQTIIALARR